MATKKGESSNISTELTVIAAFLMGFIDAYTGAFAGEPLMKGGKKATAYETCSCPFAIYLI